MAVTRRTSREPTILLTQLRASRLTVPCATTRPVSLLQPSITTPRHSRSPASTRPCNACSATPAPVPTMDLCRRPASAAISRTSTAPHHPRMWPAASRPIARSATPRLTGLRPPSITPRCSRCWASMPRWPAPNATPITTTQRFPPTATAAIRLISPAPIIRVTLRRTSRPLAIPAIQMWPGRR